MNNIFSLAFTNARVVRERFDELTATHGKSKEIASWIEENARVSINAGWFVVRLIAEGQQLKNCHEVAQERAIREGIDRETALRAALQQYYGRRIAFDRHFLDGERFRYGGMNCGGLGQSKFGRLCLILQPHLLHDNNSCLLAGDSLQVFFDSAGRFLAEERYQFIVSMSCRGCFASLERWPRLRSMSQDQWPIAILDPAAGPTGYFEVVFSQDVGCDSLESVRISETEYTHAWEMVFSAYSNEVPNSTVSQLDNFAKVLDAVGAGRIQLEVLT
ncbi:MAG: hypothetical protein NT069_14370 [Planctomycetota bacterium]|nr:hypothetical protein [Planctomycetota bacterium]